MATVSSSFDSYQFWCLSDSGFSGTVSAAEINCYKGGTFVGRLRFIKEGATMWPNSLVGSVVYLNYPLARFSEIIASLRHEKPLTIYLDTVSLMGAVGTGSEPVGEEEG
jgi:hypothetical protein